jgi:putative sigma-54 modulation protein
MRLELTGRHVVVTPDLRRQVEKGIARLDRRLEGGIVSVQAVLALEKYRHTSEFTVHTRGDHFLHGIAATNAWASSIAGAVEKIEQQLARMKGKWQGRKRRSPARRLVPFDVPPPSASTDDLRARRIRRVRRYAVKPMTVEEAALVVGSGDDTFLVFRNSATDAISVLYRRKDGDLGLIEPEV